VVAVSIAVTVFVWVFTVSSASADASGKASCVGIESSAISPPGSSDEFPGGRSELSAVVKDLSGQLGVPPGAIVSSVAKLHEGSHTA
jgi:hypothetical protein